jgi:hypothetical protein
VRIEQRTERPTLGFVLAQVSTRPGAPMVVRIDAA